MGPMNPRNARFMKICENKDCKKKYAAYRNTATLCPNCRVERKHKQDRMRQNKKYALKHEKKKALFVPLLDTRFGRMLANIANREEGKPSRLIFPPEDDENQDHRQFSP